MRWYDNLGMVIRMLRVENFLIVSIRAGLRFSALIDKPWLISKWSRWLLRWFDILMRVLNSHLGLCLSVSIYQVWLRSCLLIERWLFDGLLVHRSLNSGYLYFWDRVDHSHIIWRWLISHRHIRIIVVGIIWIQPSHRGVVCVAGSRERNRFVIDRLIWCISSPLSVQIRQNLVVAFVLSDLFENYVIRISYIAKYFV